MALLTEAEVPGDDAVKQVRWLVSEVARLKPFEQQVGELQTEVERLRPLADDGKQYRVDLVAAALAEGVRANGDSFAEETYRTMLEAAPLEIVKQMRDDWKRLGDKRFTAGRKTVDEDEREGQPIALPETLNMAYVS
jgi:hypothetical protein